MYGSDVDFFLTRRKRKRVRGWYSVLLDTHPTWVQLRERHRLGVCVCVCVSNSQDPG